MGKLINGIFGGFHGRIGNLVGYTLKGKYIVRKIGKSAKPLTPGRKSNCQKMTVVNEILSPSLPVIRAGFRLAVAGTDKNEYNEAVSYNKKNAIQGEYPNISLDYTKVLVSMGDLPVAVNPVINQTAKADEIEFNWEVAADLPIQRYNDRAMLMVYFPELKLTFYHLSGSKRVEGKDILRIDSDYAGERMEAYISFIKDDGQSVSNSVYAGSLNLDHKTQIPDNGSPEIEDIPGFIYELQDKLTQKVAGNCELRLSQHDARIVELRISSSPGEQPDIKESLSSTLSLLFEKAKVNRVVANISTDNQGIINLLKQMGFKKEGRFIENRFLNGKWVNEYQFAILKSEWDLLN
jgi:RimJ/RimL family protein N-acetyltransferase